MATGDATRMEEDEEIRTPQNALHYNMTAQVLAPHPAGVQCIAATRNMRWLFTGCTDGLIRKFDFIASMNGASKLTNALMQNQVETVTKSAILLGQIENERTGKEDEEEDDERSTRLSPVYALAVHSEAMWGVSGTIDGRINLFTIRHEQGTIVHSLNQHSQTVSVLEILPNEQQLLSGSWDRRVLLWDLNTGNNLSSYESHQSMITSLAVQPTSTDGKVFLSTSYDGACLIWDQRATSPLVHQLNGSALGSPPWCLSAAWSPDGNRVFCGRRNESVEEWDLRVSSHVTSRQLKLPFGSGPISSVKAMPNNRHLLCASSDNIRLYDTLQSDHSKHTPFQVIPGHHGATISSLFLDPTCQFMISASGNRGVPGLLENDQALFHSVINL